MHNLIWEDAFIQSDLQKRSKSILSKSQKYL